MNEADENKNQEFLTDEIVIDVLYWNELQSKVVRKHKATDPNFFLPKALFSDNRISNLDGNTFKFLISLLALCGIRNASVLHDTGMGLASVRCHSGMSLARVLHGTGTMLKKLQEKQLVSVKKFTNSSQSNVNQAQSNSRLTRGTKPVSVRNETKPKNDTSQNKEVWSAYETAYFNRYAVTPKKNAKVNSQVKQLVERLGVDDAKKVVEFYLTHKSPYYIRNTHSLGPCLKDCETLFTQMKRGVAITNAHVAHVAQENILERGLNVIRSGSLFDESKNQGGIYDEGTEKPVN